MDISLNGFELAWVAGLCVVAAIVYRLWLTAAHFYRKGRDDT